MKLKDKLIEKIFLEIPIDLIFHIISFIPRKRDKFRVILAIITKPFLYCTIFYVLLTLICYLSIGKINYLFICINFLIAYYLFIITIIKVIYNLLKIRKSINSNQDITES